LGDERDQLRDLSRAIVELREQAVEYRIRLSNGTEIFAELRKAINTEREAREFRDRSESDRYRAFLHKVILALAGMLATLISASYFISQQLAERPTRERVDQIIAGHESVGHPHEGDKLIAIEAELKKRSAEIHELRATLSGLMDEKKDANPRRGRRDR